MCQVSAWPAVDLSEDMSPGDLALRAEEERVLCSCLQILQRPEMPRKVQTVQSSSSRDGGLAPGPQADHHPRSYWVVSCLTVQAPQCPLSPRLPPPPPYIMPTQLWSADHPAPTPHPALVLPSLPPCVPCEFFMASIRGRRLRAISCRERAGAGGGGERESCVVIKHCRGLNK